MFYTDIDGHVIYQSACTRAVVDTISQDIIMQRMVAAKFDPIFAAFIAYHGGMSTHEDVLFMARTIEKNGKALLQ